MPDDPVEKEPHWTLRDKKTRNKRQAFLAAYAKCASIKAAAKAVRINRHTHHDWMKDPDYAKWFDDVQNQAGQELEDEAVRRAYQGVKRRVMHQGKQVRHNRRPLFEVEYSDALLMFLLKRFRPHLYREQTTVEHTGSVEIIERLRQGRERLLRMESQEQAG